MKKHSVLMRRITALIIDAILSVIIGGIFFIILSMFRLYYAGLVFISLPILLMIFRDSYKQSIGKTIMKLCVIDVSSSQQAPFKYRILRQITIPFILLDGIVCLATNGLRVTDFAFGTKVISNVTNFADLDIKR